MSPPFPKQVVPGVNGAPHSKSEGDRAAACKTQLQSKILASSYSQVLQGNGTCKRGHLIQTYENHLQTTFLSDLPTDLLLLIVEVLNYISAVRLLKTSHIFQNIAQDVFCKPEKGPKN